MSNSNPVLVSRPRDRTWEAYRDWVNEIAKHINPAAKDDLTDEQWQERAKSFWSQADANRKSES